jgi:hypothetical protein
MAPQEVWMDWGEACSGCSSSTYWTLEFLRMEVVVTPCAKTSEPGFLGTEHCEH